MLCDRVSYPQIAAAERIFYGGMIDRYADYMDAETVRILRARLIDGLSEVQASMELHYARETVNRKFHRGLEIIDRQMTIDRKRGIV